MSTPYLSRFRVAGFRSLHDVEVSFPPGLTVLIGPNGAGKSNLLSAMKLLPLMRTQTLRAIVASWGGASPVLHYGPKVTRELVLEVEFSEEGRRNVYHARLGFAATDSFLFLDESIAYHADGRSHPFVSHLGVGHTESLLAATAKSTSVTEAERGTASYLNRLIARVSFYHFHDTSPESPLWQSSRQSDGRFLRSDGSNLAAFLLALSEGSEQEFAPAWARINALTRRVAPYIKQLEPALVDPSRPDTSPIRLYWTDERDHRFDVSDLSDGTIRAIALITALSQPETLRPRFIAIDEPELGLHPTAVALVVALARSIAHSTQVVFSTQSPALLDEFDASEVMVVDRASGQTRFRRLQDDDLEAWLDEFSLSEVYAKNIFGGLP